MLNISLLCSKCCFLGDQLVTDGCKTIEFRGKKICCAWKLEVVVKNCGEFLVYRLGSTGFCPSAYCVKGEWKSDHDY